jgi:PHD finger-like domain-containing protein 5A
LLRHVCHTIFLLEPVSRRRCSGRLQIASHGIGGRKPKSGLALAEKSGWRSLKYLSYQQSHSIQCTANHHHNSSHHENPRKLKNYPDYVVYVFSPDNFPHHVSPSSVSFTYFPRPLPPTPQLTCPSDLVMCRKQSGIAIGRLCDKCDGKCPVCDSYVRPTTLVRICDECSFGNFQNKCVVCGGEGISDAFYCFECTRLEKDRDGCPKIINLGSSRTGQMLWYRSNHAAANSI